ncbi:hypothetical protein HK102_005892 [Quaeritorhiza haematococci]|nr:hypothetical protein HK102_005892 [Quaeritorhiza haematococci]
MQYFADFYANSYIKTCVLDALFAGTYASCPERVRKTLFGKLDEYPKEWAAWISVQLHRGLPAEDLDYALRFRTMKISQILFPPAVLTFQVTTSSTVGTPGTLTTTPGIVTTTPVGEAPDLQRYILSRIFREYILDGRIWLAVFKLKQNLELLLHDKTV